MKENQMDKSIFFITLSCVCIWLIVDMAIGKNYLTSFLSTLFPFMREDHGTEPMTQEEFEEAQENAPSSSAIGSGKTDSNTEDNTGKSSSAYTGGPGYGAVRSQ